MKRRIAIVTALTLVCVGGGFVWAYVNATGAGTGALATGTLTAPSIEATVVTPTTTLLPGGTGDATFKLDNPNSAAVTVVSVTSTGMIGVTNAPGCTSSNDGVSFTNQTSLSIPMAAHATGVVIDLTGAVFMASSSASVCQGATFSIPVTVSVRLG
jgi:hypothetical protein